MKIDIIDSKKKTVGSAELPEVLAEPVNTGLLWELVRQQNASDRAGTVGTKKRGDVSGGGKKPWKQKHTGSARHGSTREPQWRHGGVVFGPDPRDYSYDVPKKVAKGAIRSALAQRLKEGKFFVLDKFESEKPSTKNAHAMLNAISGEKTSTLVVIGARSKGVELSFRNIPRVKVLPVVGLNVRDVVRHDNLIVVKSALEALTKRIGESKSKPAAAKKAS